MTQPNRCRLYLITPPQIEAGRFAPILASALDAGDVGCVQLRLKDVDDEAVRRAAELLRPIAAERDVAFIMNDRPDLAAETGCDGVHVGQEDASYDEARRIVGRDAIVGVTCKNSRHLAMIAAEKGADYVAFGGFFPSTTKPSTKPDADRPTPEILEWWSGLMEVPCVAIGGITVENCRPLVAAGADFLSVVSGVWDYPAGPAAAVRAFNDIFANVA